MNFDLCCSTDHSYVCIAMLDVGRCAVTLDERTLSRCVSRHAAMVVDICGSMILMEPRPHPRCGSGAVELNGKLIAAGRSTQDHLAALLDILSLYLLFLSCPDVIIWKGVWHCMLQS